MFDSFTHWFEIITSVVGAFIAAVAGVAMRYTHGVQRGEPFAWSRVWLDGPTVFVMGMAGGGAGQWLHASYGMPELFGYVMASALGYIGPSAIDRVAAWLEQRKPKE